jgi:hypothetical protein
LLVHALVEIIVTPIWSIYCFNKGRVSLVIPLDPLAQLEYATTHTAA